MGIRFSLCALLRRRHADLVLPAYGRLLDAPSRSRLEGLTWKPASEQRRATFLGTEETDARGIAGLELKAHERENHFCFTFEVQLEPEMQRHVAKHDLKCFETPGPFGCMWTSISAGDRYLLLVATAPTSGMSRVLRDSQTLHRKWRDFAGATRAVTSYLELEDELPRQLYPREAELLLPDELTLAFEDDYHPAVDLMAEFVVRYNKLEF